MALDSHHAGLSVGLDTDRLLSKLKVVTITPKNIPTKEAELAAFRVRRVIPVLIISGAAPVRAYAPHVKLRLSIGAAGSAFREPKGPGSS